MLIISFFALPILFYLILVLCALRLWTSVAAADDPTRVRGFWLVHGAIGFMLGLVLRNAIRTWFPNAVYLWSLPTSAGTLFAVLAVAYAVFFKGAAGPYLVIRVGSLYGLVGALGLFVYTGLEELLTSLVVDILGLPQIIGAFLAAGIVTGLFVRVGVKSRIDRSVDEKLPVTDLADAPRHRAVIVFSDIVGYSALTAKSQDDALTMMSVFHRQARRASEKEKGQLVKTMGDGVLMEFGDTPTAIAASRQLASSFREACDPLGLPEGRLRTGIHFGEVAKRKDSDLFGDTVNIARRLEGIADPGQIVLSQAVADGLTDIELEDLGERTLKNVPEPVRCWAIKA